MDRRSFLKLLGGVAALPVVGKYFKFSKKAMTAAPKVLSDQGMPSFFYDLVAGVKKFGKKTKTTRDYDVYEFKDPKTGKKVEVIDGNQETAIGFETDRGFRGEMGVRKNLPDETTKGKTPPDEYYEGEQVYRAEGPDGYSKDWEEEISGGYAGLEDLAKKIGKADGGRVGLQAGGPPIYQTTDPKEAAKEIIRRIPQLGGSGYNLPIYANNSSNIEAYIGTPGDQVPFGIGGNIEGVGNVGIAKLRGMDDYGNPRSEYNAHWSAGTGIPNLDFDLQYNTERGPRFDLRYEKRFANGGLTDTIPPEKGPMSQGIESLFQTR